MTHSRHSINNYCIKHQLVKSILPSNIISFCQVSLERLWSFGGFGELVEDVFKWDLVWVDLCSLPLLPLRLVKVLLTSTMLEWRPRLFILPSELTYSLMKWSCRLEVLGWNKYIILYQSEVGNKRKTRFERCSIWS